MGLSFAATLGVACYVEWGLAHIAAMALILKDAWNNDASGMGNVHVKLLMGASQSKRDDWDIAYFPPFSNRLMIHEGLNLGWAGLWALFVAYVVAEQARLPLSRYVWILTLPVVFVEIGYFAAVDAVGLGGPLAEAQTFVCSIGAALLVWDLLKRGTIESSEAWKCMGFSLCLCNAASINSFFHWKMVQMAKAAGVEL